MSNASPSGTALAPQRGTSRDGLTTTAVVLAVLGTIVDLGLGLWILIDDLSYREDEWDGFGAFISAFLLVPGGLALIALLVGWATHRRGAAHLMAAAVIALVLVLTPWMLLLLFRA